MYQIFKGDFNMNNKLFDLEKKLQEASQKYYTDGTSDMTDAEFDEALKELKAENPDSDIVKNVGHGYAVDSDDTYGVKREHIYGLVGSLDKCRTWKEIDDNLKNESIIAALKLDGISAIMYYKNGELQNVLTRGDGIKGVDITDKVLRFGYPIPKHLSNDRFTGAIRGEILMSYSDFEKYKESNADVKNPRNTVAGIVNRKEVTDEDLKYLHIVVYTVVGVESNSYIVDNIYHYKYMLNWLSNEFGAYNVVPYCYNICLLESDYEIKLIDIKEQFDMRYDYPSDGIVLTNDNHINIVENGMVRFESQAFKFASEVANTEVVDIEWNMSKSNYLIPKIKVNPVQLAGTEVQYTAGFNAQYIKDNNIGIGTTVEIEKHGEIIPYINKVISSTNAVIPDICPVCGEPLVWKGVNLICENSSCGNKSEKDLLVFLKYLAPVDGFADALKFKFIEDAFGKDVTIEELLDNRDALLNTAKIYIEFLGHKVLFAEMITKLFTTKHSLADALCALNIPRLGEVTASKLAKHPDIIREWIEADTYEKWYDVKWDKIEDIVGQATRNEMHHKSSFLKVANLRKIIDIIDFNEYNSIENKGKVAITGSLSVKRSEFEKFCREHGYEPGNISKDTKYLITDNPNSSSSKNKKADEWGIKKITEQEFRDLVK